MLLSGVPTDRGALLYDDGLDGSLVSAFTRDVATVDDRGILREVDERRFGTAIGHAPLVSWTVGDSSLVAGSAQPIATGVDRDGVTPLLVLYSSAQDRLDIYRGDNFELVDSISFALNDLPWYASEGKDYKPSAAIVYRGLIVIMAERLESIGGELKTAGTSFFYTQDYGETLHRVAQVGGGFDVPVIAEGASAGKSRGRTWAFMNPFPVDGLDDAQRVWFPWADYISQSGDPKGGQIGLFQAALDINSGEWTVLPNRLVYEVWVPEDGGGLHSHGAAVTLGGVISHWGDVGYRNQTLFHEFDLSNYQTAPIATRVVYGGYDATGAIERYAPQPSSTAPAPTRGEHFASGDETPEMVLKFGALAASSDELAVSAPVSHPMRTVSGTTYDGTNISHLQWVQGRGYVSGSVVDQFHHFSPDGVTWAAINRPSGASGRAWIYGSKLLMMDDDSRPWTANLPVVSELNPLQIAPGGTNRLADSLPIQNDLGTGNERREVEYAEGVWRYSDTQEPLSPQPAAPPFPMTTPVYEVTLGPNSLDLGTWWLQPDGSTLDASKANLLDLWIYNLGSQSVRLGTRLRVPGVGANGAANYLAYESSPNSEWIPLGVRQNPPFDGEGRFAVSFVTGRSGSVNEGARFLIAPRYFGELSTPPYPLAPLTTGSNEMEVVSGFELSGDWSVGLSFQWPANAPQSMSGRMPVASLRGSDGSNLEVSVEYTVSWSARVVLEFIFPDLTSVRLDFSHNVLRGDIIEIAISDDINGLAATVRTGGSQPIVKQIAYSAAWLSPFCDFAWASGNGSTVTTVNPIFVMVDDEFAWTAEQRLGWLKSTLEGRPTFRINPYPGDYNYDGVVDAEDLEVWETNQGSTSNLAADGDFSGVIDQGDYEVWQQYLGTRAPSPINPLPGDADFNGFVDIRDFVLWRDSLGSKKILHADADRNGIVDQLDKEIWAGSFGKLIEVPPQPLPGDYNFDGTVNAADYTVWRNTLGSPYIRFADGDQNEVIEDNDRLFWQHQFGNTLPEEQPEETAAAFAEDAGAAATDSNEITEQPPTDSPAMRSRATGRGMAQSDGASGASATKKRELLTRDTAFAGYESRAIPTVGRMLVHKADEIDSSAELGNFDLPSLHSAFAERL